MIAMHREIMFIILMWRTEATEKTLSHGGKEGGKMGRWEESWSFELKDRRKELFCITLMTT